MLYRPAQQEVAFAWLLLAVVVIIFVGIGVYTAWRSRKEGIGRLVPRFLGIALGGFPIALALGGMMTSTTYTFPESYFTQGFSLGLGMLLIVVGNAISETIQGTHKKTTNQLKGTHWILFNVIPAAGVGYLLTQIKIFPVFVPGMLLAVAACQWLVLKDVFPVSPWWLLCALFTSIGYFLYPSGNLTIGFYIGGILMVIFQYFLLRPHNSEGALFFAVVTLLSWLIFGNMFDYVLGAAVSDKTSDFFVPRELRVISYYGLVTIWSSVLVGLVSARFVKSIPETETISGNHNEIDK